MNDIHMTIAAQVFVASLLANAGPNRLKNDSKSLGTINLVFFNILFTTMLVRPPQFDC